MKNDFVFIKDDRPAFMMMVEDSPLPNMNGYTLNLDIKSESLSIIKLKKGGNKFMVEKIVKAKVGFEEIFAKINEMKANLEAEKEEAIKLAIAKVEEVYAGKSADIDNVLAGVSVVEEIEVPEVTEEVVAEEVVEEQPQEVQAPVVF